MSRQSEPLEVTVTFDVENVEQAFARARSAELLEWRGSDRDLILQAAAALSTTPEFIVRTGAIMYAKRAMTSVAHVDEAPPGDRQGRVGGRDADLEAAYRSCVARGKAPTPSRVALRAGVSFETAKDWLARVRPGGVEEHQR